MTYRAVFQILIPLAVLSSAGCAHGPAQATLPRAVEPGSFMTMAESAPIETTLGHPDIAEAHELWAEMIGAAKRTLDVAEFYASDHPNSRLGPIIAAIREAGLRGVRVRFLVDESFSAKYPDTLQELIDLEGVEVRRLSAQRHMGGVQHAKYFVVDSVDAYLGSQNFDWRSLEHIQELGVRIRSRKLAGQLLNVFNTDWELAGGATASFRSRLHAAVGPVALESGEIVSFVASPKGWLPDEAQWDLPQLLKLIDEAREQVAVQLLTYSTRSFDGSRFLDLDEALRRAAGRGVRVRLLVSDWSDKPRSSARHGISGLSRVPGIEVRVITIPEWSGGTIPFARVCHSKFLVFDGLRAWIGTSNWDGDYFHKSRNVGVIVEGAPFTVRLTRVLDGAWDSVYAKPLVPMPEDEEPAVYRKPTAGQDKEKEY